MSPGAVTRRKIVGVMGASGEEHGDLAAAAGRVIAEAGYHLLTGGATGVMTAVARAFTANASRAGLSLGVVRAAGGGHLGVDRTERPYAARGPNAYVEVPILTHLPLSGEQGKDALSRNHINVLTSHAVVVLPGSDGTASELELALEYGRPVIVFVGDGTVAGLGPDELSRRHAGRPAVAQDEEALADALRAAVGAACA